MGSHRSEDCLCSTFFCEVVSHSDVTSLSRTLRGAEEPNVRGMAASVENARRRRPSERTSKYLRSVLAVENLLTLDRLRQVS